uniref:Uncharacterized protein n=1 Tax=Pithovirus LCPAC404 TaxID=2506597 RepID=A0A481ZDX4_9VIRU|nr:MAG: uncharacterized protein LCPAC404_00540 [Pithovirus LCPAC404]
MATVVNISSVIYFRAIKECLLQRYSLSGDKIDISAVKILELSCENKKCISLFCVHISGETNTGRNSHWFNNRLMQILQSENWTQLSILISSDERIIFPEIYNSQRLGKIEKSAILEIRDIELLSVENALTEAIENEHGSKSIIIGESSYYSKCMMNMIQCRKLTFVTWRLQRHILIPEYTRMLDVDGKPCGVKLKRIHKVLRSDVVRALSKGNVNLLNGGKPFPKSIYCDLMNKLGKEVAMLQDFKESVQL